MARHTSEPTIVEINEMSEAELNAYSANALKRLAIRTAVGCGIIVAASIALNVAIRKIAASADADSSLDEN